MQHISAQAVQEVAQGLLVHKSALVGLCAKTLQHPQPGDEHDKQTPGRLLSQGAWAT